MNPEDTSSEERETAAISGISVEKLREVRAAAKAFERSLPWWRRTIAWIRSI